MHCTSTVFSESTSHQFNWEHGWLSDPSKDDRAKRCHCIDNQTDYSTFGDVAHKPAARCNAWDHLSNPDPTAVYQRLRRPAVEYMISFRKTRPECTPHSSNTCPNRKPHASQTLSPPGILRLPTALPYWLRGTDTTLTSSGCHCSQSYTWLSHVAL